MTTIERVKVVTMMEWGCKVHTCSHNIESECSLCCESEKEGWMNGLKFKFKPKKYIHHAKYNQ